MPATTTPPPEIELVISFVNTYDVETGADELGSPGALGAWLAAMGVVDKGTPASGRDLRLAQRLRAALREELAAHHDGSEAGTALDEVCGELPLRAVGAPEALAPSVGGVRGALARIVAAATTARIKGWWPRLKVCPADTCRYAFYDTSRNRSRRWCSMDVCGNRSKVKAFRDRAR
jgi:predicted RNA-binding Zn ribbon-like protein